MSQLTSARSNKHNSPKFACLGLELPMVGEGLFCREYEADKPATCYIDNIARGYNL